ncbi:MAG: glycosyltransferase family 39 protein [Pseudomonadota bacterium]
MPRSAAAIPVVLFAILALVFWEGIGAWDAPYYISAATDWYEWPPSLGENHWYLRYPLILPMAGSFALFGYGEFSATLPNIVMGLLLVIVSTIAAWRHLGAFTGVALGCLVATSYPLVISPMDIEILGPELLFAAGALWLFVEALDRAEGERRDWIAPAVLAGLAAGAAWLCRETAAFVPATVAAVVLMRGFARRPFAVAVAVAAGSGAVIVAELLLYAAVAGDPLYRVNIALVHGETARSNAAENTLFGAMLLTSWHDWLLAPFTRIARLPNVYLFLVLSVIAGAWLFVIRRSLARSTVRVVIVFATAGIMSLVLTSYVMSLEHPRYFMMLSYGALVVLAIALGEVRRWIDRRLVVAALVLLCLTGPIFADFRRDMVMPRFRGLADFVEMQRAVIYLPPYDAAYTKLQLRLRGAPPEVSDLLVSEELPGPGDLYFIMEREPQAAGEEGASPPPEVVHTVPLQESSLFRRLVAQVAPPSLLPARLRNRLDRSSRPAVVLRKTKEEVGDLDE